MIKVPFRAVLISLIAVVAVGGLVVPNLQTDQRKIIQIRTFQLTAPAPSKEQH